MRLTVGDQSIGFFDFDYIKINLASPKRIREWGTRMLPTGDIIG